MAGAMAREVRRGRLWWVAVLGIVLAACGVTPRPGAQGMQPTPTLAPLFSQGAEAALVPTPERSRLPPDVLAGQSSAEQREQLVEVVIYDDTLHPDWSLEQSYGMRYDLESSIYVYSGLRASAITPLVPAGNFLLTVKDGASARYLREDIVGVSFWLSGGENYIDPDDLVSAVLGSNAYTYWIPNDPSVQLIGRVTHPDTEVFSPTRLYYLGINHSIPPDTWVEVINWLDDRIFDPDYSYITGIYIRNDSSFLDTIYVDRIVLLMRP